MSSTNNNDDKVHSLGFAGGMANTFIQSPLTPLLFAALLFMGAIGLYFTPRQEDPQISVPMVDIFFKFPGAASDQVASLATDPLERMMSEIPGVKHVYSVSERGQGMVTVQFIVGEKMETSLVKLYDKLESNKDKIPPGVTQPMVKPRGADDVPAVTLTLWSTSVDDAGLRLLALEVMQRLKEVKNTSQSFIVGGRSEQMRVEFRPERLKGYGIGIDQIASTIRSANARQDVGTAESGGRALNIYAGKFLRHAKDLETLVVGVRNGSPVYLRDVATVIEGPGEASSLVQYYTGPAAGSGAKRTNGAPAVTIAIAKKTGTNGVSVAEAILAKMETLKGRVIPDNVQVAVTRNYGQTADDKVNELLMKMTAATGAVCILIYLFLGMRPMIVVGLVIPIVVLMTVFSAWLLGYTIDRVSLFALIFSIGILVDDATVVVENIYRRWLMKGSVDTATTVDAVREVGNPTVLATFTIIAALLPMGMVSGMMGPYMMPIPVLGSIAMLFSLLAAFIFTPWLAIRIKPSMAGIKKLEESEVRFGERLDSFFRALLGPLLDSRRKARMFRIGTWVVFMAVCAMFYTQHVAVKMLPLDNKPEFNVVVNMKDGTALPLTANAIQEMTTKVLALPEVTAVQTYVGTASPFNFNGLVRHYYLRNRPWQGDIQIQLLDKGDRERSSHEIAVEARNLLTPIADRLGIKIAVVEMPPGPPVLQTMVAEIYGPDAETRRQVARDMTKIFEQATSIVDVDNYLQDPHDTWVFEVNQRKAEHRNVTVEAIGQQLSMVMGGYRLGSVKVGQELEARHIILQAPLGIRGQISRLGELPIRARDGKLVSLGELGSFVPRKQDPVIYHKDLRAIEYVTGEVAGRLAAPVYGMLEVAGLLKDYKTPAGVALTTELWSPPENSFAPAFEWTGEWTVTVETFRDMGLAFMAALVLIYMLVVLEFGNFRLPGIIMAPIPLTLIGIIPGHWLLGAEFTATSMIGWIALAGIIVRNSILLVDYSMRAVEGGMSVRESVLAAVRTRTRPILITQLTMIAGSASILDDPIFQGMAISLLFGAVIATVLTLVVIPLACANASSSYVGASGPAAELTMGDDIPTAGLAAQSAVQSAPKPRKPKGPGLVAGIGGGVKAQAEKSGFGWLKPVYIMGAFVSESVAHLMGRAEPSAAVVAGAGSGAGGRVGASSSSSSSSSAAAARVKSSLRTADDKGAIASILAPISEAFNHLLGRPVMASTSPMRAANAKTSSDRQKQTTRTSSGSGPTDRTGPAKKSPAKTAKTSKSAKAGQGKSSGAKSTSAKSTSAKSSKAKADTKKPTAKKTVVKKTASRKPVVKKAVTKKATTKKTSSVRAVTKTPIKKAAVRSRAVAKKPAAKTARKSTSSSGSSAGGSGKKSTTKKSSTKKPPAKKPPLAKSTRKEAMVAAAEPLKDKKPVAKSKSVRTTAPKSKATSTSTVKSAAKKPSAKSAGARKKAKAGRKTKIADDLTRISGIGPMLAEKLASMGVTTFEQIAHWNEHDVEQVDGELNFKGRIEREKWVSQAKSELRAAQMRAANEKMRAAAKKK